MKEEERGEEVVVEVEGAAFLKMTGMKMKLQPQIYKDIGVGSSGI